MYECVCVLCVCVCEKEFVKEGWGPLNRCNRIWISIPWCHQYNLPTDASGNKSVSVPITNIGWTGLFYISIYRCEGASIDCFVRMKIVVCLDHNSRSKWVSYKNTNIFRYVHNICIYITSTIFMFNLHKIQNPFTRRTKKSPLYGKKSRAFP